jgi:type IV pilus biogenesis protein PilP
MNRPLQTDHRTRSVLPALSVFRPRHCYLKLRQHGQKHSSPLQQNNGYDTSLPSSLTQTLVAQAPAGTTASETALPLRTSLPRIVEIAGIGKALRTRLILTDGISVEVATGQRIPGTIDTVSHISAQEVQITTAAGEVHTLPFCE